MEKRLDRLHLGSWRIGGATDGVRNIVYVIETKSESASEESDDGSTDDGGDDGDVEDSNTDNDIAHLYHQVLSRNNIKTC